MPGPIVHLIVEQRLAAYVRRSGRDRRISELLAREPCSPYTGFGSMGPDFLFFSMREYGSAIGDLTNFIFDAYDAIEPIVDFVTDAIEPIKNAIDEAISFLLPDDLEALINELGATASTLGSALLAVLGRVVTGEVDLFYPFYPKIQKGAPENEWYWFDFLHYRRTGQFCSNMWKLSQGDDDLMRYVMGYASHIGTDVVGHPFVNAIVGGPYRCHWHRHKLVENWIDAWSRKRYPDSKTIEKCLRIGPEDKYRPGSISGSYYSRLCEFPGQKLPRKLGDMMLAAMKETYDGPNAIPHPVTFSFDDLDDTYRLWIKWFERATSIGDSLPPTAPPPPGSAASALVTDYVDVISDVWDGAGGGGGGGGGFSIWGIFAAIFDFIRRIIETIAKTIEFIITHISDILLLPLAEATALIRWLVYQVHLGLWQIYDESRFALVLGGYLFPDERDLTRMPWAEAFVNAANAHTTGGPFATFSFYPRKRQAYALTGATELHLVYPATLHETPRAEPCPLPLFGVYPNAMIDGLGTGDPAADEFFDCVQPYPKPPSSPSLDFTWNVERTTWTGRQLGASLPFSARLVNDFLVPGKVIPNFNLDGDRGYGFLTWRLDGLKPTDPEIDPAKIETNPVNVSYGSTV